MIQLYKQTEEYKEKLQYNDKLKKEKKKQKEKDEDLELKLILAMLINPMLVLLIPYVVLYFDSKIAMLILTSIVFILSLYILFKSTHFIKI